ncbi:hypothetical protein P7K49_030370 [Saguinus oedipus]|uniref:Uncharacterized protein n=1 Tax=Saguinus oedipus TaxID=9490 RepID=A0ABQ9U2Q6_SAGOE|nr:hypothetical protein P7K49_030370 [Saguinus oedipus]
MPNSPTRLFWKKWAQIFRPGSRMRMLNSRIVLAPPQFKARIVQTPPHMRKFSAPYLTPLICIGSTYGPHPGAASLSLGTRGFCSLLCQGAHGPQEGGVCVQWDEAYVTRMARLVRADRGHQACSHPWAAPDELGAPYDLLPTSPKPLVLFLTQPALLSSGHCQGHPRATVDSETSLPHIHTLSNPQHTLQKLSPLTSTDT